jgi:hypothetical protein
LCDYPQNLDITPVAHFSSSCQILPYVATEPGGEVVYPSGGHWGCLAVITQFTLGPGAEKRQTLLIRGGTMSGDTSPAVALDRGHYSIHATVVSAEHSLHADPVSLTVR